jgi:hypothetical protein
MTNKKEVAQAIWNTYVDGYSKALMTPVEQFDTYLDPYSKRIIADILRELVAELQYYQFCREEGVEDMVLDDRAILDVCDELENL